MYFHSLMGAFDHAWNIGNSYSMDKSVNIGTTNLDRLAKRSTIDVQMDHKTHTPWGVTMIMEGIVFYLYVVSKGDNPINKIQNFKVIMLQVSSSLILLHAESNIIIANTGMLWKIYCSTFLYGMLHFNSGSLSIGTVEL